MTDEEAMLLSEAGHHIQLLMNDIEDLLMLMKGELPARLAPDVLRVVLGDVRDPFHIMERIRIAKAEHRAK